jgi:hypothetical protein
MARNRAACVDFVDLETKADGGNSDRTSKDAVSAEEHEQGGRSGLFVTWRRTPNPVTFRAMRRWVKARSRLRWRHRLTAALRLEIRGAVAHDQLKVKRCTTQLEIEWFARELHPWDRDLSPDQQTKMFVDRAVVDTVAAIEQLFEDVPEIDDLNVRVWDRTPPGEPLLFGTVSRAELEECPEHCSPMMKLKSLGLVFQSRVGLTGG